MMKRMFALLVCLCVLLGCIFPVYAAEETEEPKTVLVIENEADFLAFAENCRLDSYSEGLTVSLEADIDLNGEDFAGIPIFCGTFDGNGHTIHGMQITGEGSARGMFRYLTDTAVVQDLAVQGNVRPGGSRMDVGGIAGSNAGKISNVQFTGTVSGSQNVGGIAGSNTVSGIIEDCKTGGVITGNHFTGGIAGVNSGVVRDSQNLAVVNSTARQNQVSLEDITLDSLINAEASDTATDIGGIAGSSSGVIRSCVNRGAVGYRHMGYNIGGISGSQSGYIADCVNYGEILGRKEVGGIVGQMEPAARIEYEEDALQILEQQLSAMGNTINNAAANARIGAQDVENQIYDLQDSMDSAKDSLELLIPDPEDPQPPSADSILAAQNGISDSLSDMTGTLWGIGEATDSTMGSLSNDLYRLQDQINAMRATLGNVSNTVGGSIVDVSDEDTQEDLNGEVSACVNYGNVLADLNAGGIAGAMALENDLDPEDDWRISGSNSLNFESELRAVIWNCENSAKVTVRKQNAGGIVGWQSMGLVKDSRNSGMLDAAGADYVGGISGLSTGYLRHNAARCSVSGSSWVGGIAGSATVVTNCSSMVQLRDVKEAYGAVLGTLEEPQQEMETPIAGNRYLAANTDPGGIDGVSYEGLAQAVDIEEFLSEETLPEMFRTVTITFRDAVGNVTRFRLAPGEGLEEKDIPAVPVQEGRDGEWEGLDEADLTQVYFDRIFQAVYTDESAVIQSKGVNQSGKPVVLLEGSFPETTEIKLSKPNVSVGLTRGQKLLDHWQYSLTGEGTVTTLRLCLPEDADKEQLKLLTMGADGYWSEAEFAVEGSYGVIDTDAAELTIAILQEQGTNWLLIGGIAAAVVIVVLGFVVGKKKKKG